MGINGRRTRCGQAVVGALTLFVAGTSFGCAGPKFDHVSEVATAAPTLTEFTYDPGDSRPSVTAHVAVPAGDLKDAEILLVLPSGQRTAQEEAQAWSEIARERDLVVVVPEFGPQEIPASAGLAPSSAPTSAPEPSTPDSPPASTAPGIAPDDPSTGTPGHQESPIDPAYALGGMVDPSGYIQSGEHWTWSLVDGLLGQVRMRTGCPDSAYSMFGHGIGAQFVTRFVEFNPSVKVEHAVAANADWYTMPSNSARFPYGLDGVDPDEGDLDATMAAPLTVLVGADDTARADTSARMFGEDPTSAQGRNRLERGQSFYAAGQRLAAEHNWPFRWQLVEVPGVGHDEAEMAEAALPYLFD